MRVAVRIAASVPDHASSLAETVESFREVGDLEVYHVGPAGAVAASAADLGVPLIEIEDSDDDGAAMTRILADDPDRTRLVVHADEVIERGVPPAELAALGVPATAVVLHRVNDVDSYTEEVQVRLVPPGAGYTFAGRYAPRVRRDGRVLGLDEIVASGIVVGHYPARRPQLAIDHVRRSIRHVQRAFEDEPDDAGHLHQLIYWHWTLNDWDGVVRLLPRWQELAPEGGHEPTLVDYFAACASLGRRDIAGARRWVASALRRSDRFADAWFLQGELRRLARDPRGAAEAFERAAALGAGASPVAVEDHSLGTWRPLLELARLAEGEGRTEAAAELRRRAEEARAVAASLPGGHAGPPA
jgi:hypothetical protein